MGQVDQGELNDDYEDYLNTVWDDMLLSQDPVKASKYPGLPGTASER